MSIAVSMEEVSVKRGSELVVRNVNLTVRQGSWFGLIGSNGSGKTSLLRGLSGRLPIDAGRCLIDGDELSSDRGARARRFGFAPPADQLPDALRAREILAIVGGRVSDALAHLGPLREALELDPLLDRWIGDCSTGIRQRLAIATAFAGGHSLVVLDEPFNWLDPVASFDVRRSLRSMVDNGLTLLSALHDFGTLATCCDAGALIVDGELALELERTALRKAAERPALFEHEMIDLLRSRNAGAARESA